MSTRKPQKPSLVGKWYLADDVRNEVGGKCTLVGLYSDDQVIIQMPSSDPDPTPENPVAIEGLAALCSLKGLKGSAEFEVTVSGTHPGSNSRTQKFVASSVSANHTLNLISRLRPVMIESFGKKSINLRSKKLGFDETYVFQVLRGDIPEPDAPPKARIRRIATTSK